MSTVEIEFDRRTTRRTTTTSGGFSLENFTTYFSLAVVGFGMVGAVANAFDLLDYDVFDRATFVVYYLLPLVTVQSAMQFIVPDFADSWFLGVRISPDWAGGVLWRNSSLSNTMAVAVYAIHPTPIATKAYWILYAMQFAFTTCYINLYSYHANPVHVTLSLLSAITFTGFWLSTNPEL